MAAQPQPLAIDGKFQILLGQPGEFHFDDEFPRGVHQHIGVGNPESIAIGRHVPKLSQQAGIASGEVCSATFASSLTAPHL